ncbi:GNAT family protein [Colletotrichum karsti]|uniref:GNAT family protein n=1 Tax=Colletotrichum karsti TaxID=1095194 RepID=A0A9P6LGT5_9PEZI|nr:GNAT family protein [Colletotrichum karsti]KAF9875564.1 GNAT family protein [Colletotrichum karsti]
MDAAHNFCFPVRVLTNARVKLTPFRTDRHAAKYIESTREHPEIYAHTVSGPYKSVDDFVSSFVEGESRTSPGMMTYAIIDKTRPPSTEDDEGEMAGRISFANTTAAHLCTEIGYIVIFPKYQRTHVTTNAVGLMLQEAFKSPEDGGFGIRKVLWQAHAHVGNRGSVRLAERMGFREEGIRRWHRLFPRGRLQGKIGNGRPLPPGSDPDDIWRDSVLLGLCWDDWLEEAASKVQEAMDRNR